MKHMPHGHRSLTVALFATAIAVLVLTLASAGRPAPVAADLGDGHTTNAPKGKFDPSARPPGRITRNLIDGEPLTVCSDVFPKATADAVERWNDKLSREVLTFEKDSVKCQNARRDTGWTPRKGVKTVFVSVGEVTTDQMGEPIVRGKLPNAKWCVGTPIACVRQDDVDKNGVWRTRYGRMEVIVNPERFCRDVDTQPDGNCPDTVQDRTQKSDDDLRHLITHELGHALSLGDYFCNHYNDAGAGEPHPDIIIDVDTIMDTLWRQACNPGDGSPTPRDVSDYVKIYTPAVVVVGGRGVDGRRVNEPEVDGQTVTLHWNQANVFVESDFEIQRKNGMIWEAEEIAPANDETVTLTNQPSGEQRYQIVARTKALPAQAAGQEYFYGKPSAVIEVSVPLPAPTDLTVGARTPVRLTLSWTAGVGASFHEVKATTRANCNEKSETYETPSSNSATSHPLTGLTPNTSYRLCVRGVRTIGSDSVRSAWAETAATMTAAKLAAPSTRSISSSDITTNTITLRWSAVPDADGYEVKATKRANCNLESETYGTPNPKNATSHRFPRLTSNTSYRLCVRATLDAHSAAKSAWASRSARTSADPAPQPVDPVFTLSASASANSCFINETVRVTWSTRNGSGDVAVTVNGFPVTTSPISVRCQSTAGSQRIVVSARDSAGSFAGHTFYVTVKEAQSLVECLAHTGYGGTVLRYRGSVCLGATASALWSGLASSNIVVGCITKWDVQRQEWLQYQSGRADFNIVVSEVLILSRSGCSSSGDASGASGAGDSACADAVKPAEGPAAVSVGGATCLIVRSGGAVEVSDGSHTLNLSLPTGRDWALLAAADFIGSSAGVFWFLDLASGGWLALNPADGAELARYAPVDAEGLSALLDAIVASASAPAATE